MKAVSASVWDLDLMKNEDRRRHLLSDISPRELIDLIVEEVKEAVSTGHCGLRWSTADENVGFRRVEAVIRLSFESLDLLFNGRMGYRAQYYRSTRAGQFYNRTIIERVTPIIAPLFHKLEKLYADLFCKSLIGPHSKIWFAGDWVHHDDPPELTPTRWTEYWVGKEKKMGLIAPQPKEPMLDIKGTWISPVTGAMWLPEHKKLRDQEIHLTGWT